jgi:hypothetical protein
MNVPDVAYQNQFAADRRAATDAEENLGAVPSPFGLPNPAIPPTAGVETRRGREITSLHSPVLRP